MVKKTLDGWIIIGFEILMMMVAVISGINGHFQISYGLSGLMLFSYFIGYRLFGWKKLLLMNLVSATVTFALENLSICTGFPFGHFIHLTGGPRLGQVPLAVGVGYFFLVFAGWYFADLLIGGTKSDAISKIGRAVIGACVASSLDLSIDAILGLVNGGFIYPNGGGFFGTPLSNSLGWMVTAGIILLIWEFFLLKDYKTTVSPYHLQNSLLLGMQVLTPLIGFFMVDNKPVIDSLGYTWQTHFAYEASAMIALLTLVFAMMIGGFVYLRRRHSRA